MSILAISSMYRYYMLNIDSLGYFLFNMLSGSHRIFIDSRSTKAFSIRRKFKIFVLLIKPIHNLECFAHEKSPLKDVVFTDIDKSLI